MRMLRAVYVAGALAIAGLPAVAQQIVDTDGPGVVVVDTDELFRTTIYGKRVTSELETRARALQAENDRITADLTSEEKSLTERRPNMDPAAFRVEAAEFDARVQGIRRSRDAAIAAFETDRENAPRLFMERVRTTLGELMVERGAVVMLNQNMVLLSLSRVDITNAAIARIDADLGDGSEPVADQ